MNSLQEIWLTKNYVASSINSKKEKILLLCSFSVYLLFFFSSGEMKMKERYYIDFQSDMNKKKKKPQS